MRKLIFICFVSLLGIAFSPVSAQQVFKTTSPSVIAYLEYLPPDYNANSDKYPILFFLHGIGERGPNSTDPAVLSQYIQNVAKHGPPKYVNAGTKFPFIVISPQLKNNYGSWPTDYIMEVINHCKNYLRIDERRIYLTGLSLGGGGVWSAAQDYPELFAAIAPVCGGSNNTGKACGIASENLPVWAFHGDLDTVVPLSRSQTMVNAINACVPAPSPLAKLSIYAGVAHNAWDNAYRIDNLIHTPNVYDWMMSYTNLFNKGNRIPAASAGSDLIVSATTATINGSGTDTDGTISSYSWTKISGPAAVLSNASSSVLSLSALEIGEYIFRLKVSDNSGNTDSDYIKVTVQATAKNMAPVANAGIDKSVMLPNAATISGTAADSDGFIVSYLWTKVSGGTATLSGHTTATLTASGLTQGMYVFRLMVTDNNGATHEDDMTLTVNPAMPVVNAGTDRVIRLPMNSTILSGSATDADGSIASYSWTKISGEACGMYNTTTASLGLNNLVSGVYTFRLTATDNNGYTGSDDIIITVDAPPVVNAGEDKTLYLPESSIVLNGSATDPDGNIVKYVWSKISGPNFLCGPIDTPSWTINKMYEGVYVFKLAVTDHLGAVGMDYVTVTVKNQSTPVVNAGADHIVRLPLNSATLTGSATDPDGIITSYLWTKVSGGTCHMYNTTTSSLGLGNLLAGVYTFRLTATDNSGNTGNDDIIVTVDAPPVVDAGPDQTIILPNCSTVMNGLATDSDGTIVKYVWSKMSGPNFLCGPIDGPSWTINKMYEGVYVLKLAVTDNLGAVGVDYVTVTVKAAAATGTMSTGSTTAEQLEMTNSSGLAANSSSDQILGRKTQNELKDCTVIIFNDSGKQIYKGSWSLDKNHEVLNKRGLYMYNIIKDGVRIDTGKVYIKDI